MGGPEPKKIDMSSLRVLSVPSRKAKPVRNKFVISNRVWTTIIGAILLVTFTRPLKSSPAESFEQNNVAILEQWARQDAKSRMRIFVYELPAIYNKDLVANSLKHPAKIRDPFCATNFYSAERSIHQFLLQSPARTHDPRSADFFFVPIYITCHYLNSPFSDEERLQRTGEFFQRGMNYLSSNFDHFNRSFGRDHVLIFTQGYGARLGGVWEKFKNSIFLVHNGEFGRPEYTVFKDITIPPDVRYYLSPTYIREKHQSRQPKKFFAHFGGQVVNLSVADHRGANYSGGVRQYIVTELASMPKYRITGTRDPSYVSDMKSSTFCLCPEGWHPWTPRPYYAILLGCIPVIISESQEMAFETIVDFTKLAVFVRPKHIRQINSILRNISKAEQISKLRYAAKYWRVFWYGPNGLANEALLEELYSRKRWSDRKRSYALE